MLHYCKQHSLILLILLSIVKIGFSQLPNINCFEELELKIENQVFRYSSDTLRVLGENHLRFAYEDVRATAEIKIYPKDLFPIRKLELLQSADYELLDSITNINGNYFRFKIRFKQLTKSDFIQLTFSIVSDAFVNPYIQEVNLLQTTETTAFLTTKDKRLFVGEEKSFQIETNRPNNIRYNSQWTRDKNINYKFSLRQGALYLQLLPNSPGRQKINIPLRSKIPSFDTINNSLVYDLAPINFAFDVQQSKLVYLSTNKKEITLNEVNQREGVEIELEYHPSLELNKTYRVEPQEEGGGYLVAEIFTRSILSNGRVLCWLRTYQTHRQSEGYLYIKDGDDSQFITNLNITPKTQINQLSVVSAKGNMSKGTVLYPGERVEIIVQGIGLKKGQFTFAGLAEVSQDSIGDNENELRFKALVPIDINTNEVVLLNYGKPTGNKLRINEFQIAHPLDFVLIETEEIPDIAFSDIDQTVFLQKTIPDLIIKFDPNKIDSRQRLFGKQYLKIDIVITNKNNQLLDRQTIENIVICPGSTSPRNSYYDDGNCRFENIALNQFIRQKTFDLEAWSRIEIVIQHDRSKYGGQGFYKKAEIISRRSSTFDLDVSFPAGLVTKRVGEDGFGNLSGVSMAIIAQFSFYHPQRIAKTRPFKIGAGFLALNAFNFSENASNRDVGVVVLGSLYPVPTKQRSKLSFPLYLGGGYFLSESKFFYLIGPGIRLRI